MLLMINPKVIRGCYLSLGDFLKYHLTKGYLGGNKEDTNATDEKNIYLYKIITLLPIWLIYNCANIKTCL